MSKNAPIRISGIDKNGSPIVDVNFELLRSLCVRDEQLAMSSQEPQDQSSIEALRKRRARIHKAAAKSHGIDKPPSYERCRKQLKQRGIFAAEHDHLHVILEHVMVLLHTPQADLKMGPCTYCIPWTV